MNALICPVCSEPLHRVGTSFRCANLHTFDLAREGYVNLYLTRRKPKILGDTKEMIHARRRFLNAGFYKPLMQGLADAVDRYISKESDASHHLIADAGCGEGAYLGFLYEKLKLQHQVDCYGFDIAKDAVRLAARRYPSTQFAVADINRQIPLLSQSTSILLNIFAPRNPPDFARILEPNGLLLVVIPTMAHLSEIRQQFDLMQIEPEKEMRIIEQMANIFTLEDRKMLDWSLELPNAALLDLIRMTPNAWHLSDTDWQEIAASDQCSTTASFEILQFRKLL